MKKKNRFAQRTNWPLEENNITRILKEFKEHKTAYINLTESNPTKCGFSYPQKEVLDALQRKENFSYEPEAKGLLKARESVADYFQSLDIKLHPDDIFLTASTSEAYGYIFRLLTDPGDHILFPQPSYPLFSFLGDIHDVHLQFYQLYEDQGWHIDFESLKEKIDTKTKAICLVNPNNPTGSYISQEERHVLTELCAEHDLALICDEVFWEYTLEEQNPITFLQYDTTPTFVLGGLSKTLGFPQMKLGWMVVHGPQEWKGEALKRLEVIADTYLSVNTPAQHALASWLSLRKELFTPILKRIQTNWTTLKAEVGKVKSVKLIPSAGGWYALLQVPLVRSEEEWVLKLLSKYHVYVHPGYFYDFLEEGYLVLSLLPEPAVFLEGIQRLLSRIEQQCVKA